MNYFEFYGLNANFYIDDSALKVAYYDKMRSLHPDMNMHASEEDKAKLLLQSSYNNKAYNTLRDFHKRLDYIVANFAADSSEEKKSLPQMFLMEMMDVNEEVMELQFDYSVEKADEIKSAVLAQEKEMLEALESNLKESTITDPFDRKIADEINNYLLKRNYLNRLVENIEKLSA